MLILLTCARACVSTALPILGRLAVSYRAVPRLPEGQAGGAREGRGAVWHGRRADGARLERECYLAPTYSFPEGAHGYCLAVYIVVAGWLTD